MTPIDISEISKYYSRRLEENGETPQGVDWNGEPGQTLRFQQLCKIIELEGSFSVNDLGCGYGALYDYLQPRYPSVHYYGQDVSADMVEAGRRRFSHDARAEFQHGSKVHQIADYGFASGIFNVRLGFKQDDWAEHFRAALDMLNATSRLGFSFNCLTSYSDADRMKDHLYYASPADVFDHCMKYSRHVALLHDYELYEFTILVRKH